MTDQNRIRLAGLSCIAGAVLFQVSLFIEYGFDLQPPGNGTLFWVNQAMFQIAIVGFVIGIVGMMWDRAADDGWFGKASLGLFALGWVVIIAATIGSMVTGNDSWLFPVGGLAITIGSLLSGVAVVVAHRWQDWRRWTVLIFALYYLALLLLLAIADFEPILISESLMVLAWLLIGLAVYTRGKLPISDELPILSTSKGD